jgi:TetR/AcrR family transcriptional regulator, cholesterol catabolism regulator
MTEVAGLPAMPLPQTKSERTRQRILDAAAEVLAEKGYEARLADIAHRAGMQAGSLYYHFESREDLVAEILKLGIEKAWDHVAAAVGRLPSSATPLDRLAAAMRAHTRSIVGLSTYAQAQARIVSQLPQDLAQVHRKDLRAYGEYWHELFADAQRAGQIAGDVDLVAARMLAFGAMNWTSEWFRPTDEAAIDRLAEQTVRLFLNGVTAAAGDDAAGDDAAGDDAAGDDAAGDDAAGDDAPVRRSGRVRRP